MTVTQFIIGYGFTTIGYPVGVTLVQTIFSKILGPRPQGVWMGLITGAGCASRVLGPVFVSSIYKELGIYETFGITGLTLVVSMIWLMLVNKRLIPIVAETKLQVELPLMVNTEVTDTGQQKSVDRSNDLEPA